MKISRNLARSALCVSALAIGLLGTARGAVDMFLKLDDVSGETTDSRHRGESEVLKWSFGATSPALADGTIGRAIATALTVEKVVDSSSPVLQLACASGKHYQRAVLTLRHQGQTQVEFARVVLQDVTVTNIVIGMSEGTERMTETVSLSFAKVGVEYFTIVASGLAGERREFAWNFKENLPGGVIFPGTAGMPDQDKDGLPDDWESQFGLDPAVNDARLDQDRDGATNLEEFVAGTSPIDLNQVFRATLALPTGGQSARLTWASSAGKTYNILIGLLLGANFQLFRTVSSAGDETTSVDLPAGAENRFYRVEVVP